MQMQATMLELVPTAARPGSSSTASRVTSADPRLRFDQLLGQARTSLASICQEAGVVAPLGCEAAAASVQEEIADKNLGAIAALLAQAMGLGVISSQLQEQSREPVEQASEGLSTIDNGLDEFARAGTTDLSQLVPRAAETTAAVPLSASSLSEPFPAAMRGIQDGQPSPPLEESAVSPNSPAELLTHLQAETPEVGSGLMQAQADQGTKPKQWGQMERYWLLRGAELSESETGLQQVAQGAEFATTESFLEVVEDLSNQTAAALQTEEPDVLTDGILPAEALGQAKETEQINQFGVYSDVLTANLTMSDVEAPAAASYTARPGTPLEQQLEQGMAIGLRQLRLLRSPEGITVRMQLYPESLGEVRIELKLEGNMLTAQLRTLQPQATEALRLELPLLRENLVNQGFSQVFLGAETAEQFGQSPGREQQRFQEEHARRLQRVGVIKTEAAEELEVTPATMRLDYRL